MRRVKDRVVQHPHRYRLVPVAGTTDTYDLERVPGTVTEEGTAVNRQLFNSIDSALLCTHSKSGTVHTFTLNSAVAAFVPGQTIYTVKAALTASIEYGDTFTLTDGTTSYTGIVPKTSEGGNYRVTLFANLHPVVIFEVNLGGSAKHAFFRGGGGKRLFREVFTASGAWTCPDFVDEVFIQAFGGGGGGGGSGSYSGGACSGGGGGGGYMATGVIRVTPGEVYALTVGSGGSGGAAYKRGGSDEAPTYTAPTDGEDGGATVFASISASGGAGGTASTMSESGAAIGPGSGGNGGAGGGAGRRSDAQQPLGTPGVSAQFADPADDYTGGNGYGLFSAGGVSSGTAAYIKPGGGGGGSYGAGGSSYVDGVSTVGQYGGGGCGGCGGGGKAESGSRGGDGILFISYYADPSMLADREPEEFDIAEVYE